MARPKSSRASQKKRPPPKAQHQAAERPSKRRARGNLRADDVYEASDEDPAEFTDTKRYDQVDDYNYEMPSDFEDEEIDEDLAFTAEDRKRYGGLIADLNDRLGGGDVSDEGGFDDEDDAADVDDEDEAAFDEEDGSEDDTGGEGQPEDELGDELQDDDLGFDLDDDDDDEEEDEDQDEADPEDDDRYRDMLASVLGDGKASANDRKARMKQQVIQEAYPEAEFALNAGAASTGAGELSLADLMAGLDGKGRQKLPSDMRKELERISKGTKSKLVSAPAPKAIRERSERRAGYQTSSKDVSKWQDMVKANREAPTLVFTKNRDEVPRINTTAAIVAQHTPETEMETEVAALLKAAGAASVTAVAAAEEALAMKELSMEEAKARRDKLAKLRSLLFYHELKAKRLKKIKSKEYRKKLAKTEKRKEGRALLDGVEDFDPDDPEAVAKAERDKMEQQEFDRAKERLTLKHRNTSRWARRALKRGATLMDAGTKEAVAEQLRMGEALRRRIEGRDDSSDDDDDSVASGSGSEGEAGPKDTGRGMTTKAKAAALDILTGADPLTAEDAPKKGLFALPFMARALERQRQQAQQQAQQTLQDLEQEQHGIDSDADQDASQGATGVTVTGRQRFGAGVAAAKQQALQQELDKDEDMAGGGSDDEEDVEAKAERLQKALPGSSKAAEKASRSGGATQKQSKLQSQLRAPTAEEEAELNAALSNGGYVEAVAPAATAKQHRSTAPSTSGHAAAASPASFIPAKKFEGPKAGYIFKKDKQGLGYYIDTTKPSTATKSSHPQQQQGVKQGQKQKQKGGKEQSQAIAGKDASNVSILGFKPTSDKKSRPEQGRSEGSKAAGGKAPEVQASIMDVSDSDDDHNNAAGMASKEGMVPAPNNKAASQKALVSMAFAGDDVEADFEAEKAAEVAAELPKTDEPSALPGWGAWSAEQRDPKWMKNARAKAAREREKAAAGRSDAAKPFVVLSEKWDRRAMEKYTVPEVPFPFNDRDVYERSIRQPLGKQFNPDASFRDMIRPAVLKNTGVIIEPIRYSKALGKHATEMVKSKVKAKTLVVTGGVMRKSRKQK